MKQNYEYHSTIVELELLVIVPERSVGIGGWDGSVDDFRGIVE